RGQVDSADVDRYPVQAEVPLDRALVAQRLFDEVGDQAAVPAQLRLDVGTLPECLQRRAEQPHGGFLTGGEDVGRDARHVFDLGNRAVGEGGGRQPGQHVVA